MSKFMNPEMNVQKLEQDDFLCTSGCKVEAQACLECYGSAITCNHGYECTGLVCPTLQSFFDDDDD